MNTASIKAHAPQARREFIQAVTDKASLLGLTRDRVEPMEIKGDVAIVGSKAFPRRTGQLRAKLEARIRRQGFDQVMEAMAYTWFNRFVALRYMEIHDYLEHGYRVLSNRSGSDIPEVLEHAASVDFPGLDKEKIIALRLAGDKDNELYRMLLVAQCNALHKAMPFLFGRIDDQTELLLPDNLLHSQSPIRKLVQAIAEADWQEVEIIGWLYQFYISEKKDQVIGKVVKTEDIPAATQLFTPNWIVKYMVHNTLGRQWLATYPDSRLREKMEYYVEPAEQTEEVKAQIAAITPLELDPESLTLMDPACGSGHILVEAYNIFKEIYLERGYRTRDIPRLILEKNLFGLEICDRAAQLAGFALLMKARADDRRICAADNPVQLNILTIQESKGLDVDEIGRVLLQERVVEMGRRMPQQQHLFQPQPIQAPLSRREKPEVSREELSLLLRFFEEARTMGSLLIVPDELKHALPRFELLLSKVVDSNVQSRDIAAVLLPLVKQAELLAKNYSLVVTNPPYMGGKGLNPVLKAFAQGSYPDTKSDLYAMFMERIMDMVVENGFVGFMTPFTWMFLISYEKLRSLILNENTLTNLVRPEYHAFFDSAYVPICSFTMLTNALKTYKGKFIDLASFYGADLQALKTLEAIRNPDCGWSYNASAGDFKKIPSSPIAYWVDQKVIDAFQMGKPLSGFSKPVVGLQTGDNERFIRFWYEVDLGAIGYDKKSRKEALDSGLKWFPYAKGGEFRKWYGNNECVVNWENDGEEIRRNPSAYPRNRELYFREGFAYTNISSSFFAARYTEAGSIFDQKGSMFFSHSPDALLYSLALLHSVVANVFLRVLCPTLDFNPGSLCNIPVLGFERAGEFVGSRCREMVRLAKDDWDSTEVSWSFKRFPFLDGSPKAHDIEDSFNRFRLHRTAQSQRMLELEIENNRFFIEAYGLRDLLTPQVPEDQITMSRANRESDIKQLISYAIGCMMGRYSLDQPGLVYAHSGNIGFDLSKYPTFPADEDGIIPVMDMNWFPDDATHRFVEFLKVAWSPETLDENLRFVADSLSPKRGESPIDTIRRYLSTSFFKDHLKTYKRRPIYWLFSSGRHKAFECLVYLHRYNEATLSRMRGAYITPLQGKLNARIEYLRMEVDKACTSAARKKLEKELETLKNKQTELARFDEELRHYADRKIALDLDDGVKVNYGKFGNLLAERKAVTGE